MIKTPIQGLIFYPRNGGGISQMQSAPWCVHHDIISLVSVLLVMRRPAAVSRRIISIIVDALNRQPRLPRRGHVVSKRLEILPSFTNPNTAPPIQSVIDCAGIVATRPHAYPTAPKGVLFEMPLPLTSARRIPVQRAADDFTLGAAIASKAYMPAVLDPDLIDHGYLTFSVSDHERRYRTRGRSGPGSF